MCLQLLWQKLNFWRALRKRSPLWKVWMATALVDCSGTAYIVTASPDFQYLQVRFSPSASRICSFCKSDLFLLQVRFALLQVGFVPFLQIGFAHFARRICSFYKPWFPSFGSGRQNWTGGRQNAVTNRPETGPWQPGEYFLDHHF